MDAYSSTGMPVGYHHWSFGKQFLSTEQGYRRGHMGLGLELALTSNPCISYLMEEHHLKALVIAHACFGHNSFLRATTFQTPDRCQRHVNYLIFLPKLYRLLRGEVWQPEGPLRFLPCPFRNYGVDRYRRPTPISLKRTTAKRSEEYLQHQVNDPWRTIPKKEQSEQETTFSLSLRTTGEHALFY